jgi:hypothetical protein
MVKKKGQGMLSMSNRDACPFGNIQRKYQGTRGEGIWINTIMGHACELMFRAEAVVDYGY